MKTWFLVPAAGTGSRFGGDIPKQYASLAGKTVIEHTLERLLSLNPDGIALALSPGDDRWAQLPLSRDGRIHPAQGGAERADSVAAGLALLSRWAGPDDWVLVHDVARPCVRPDDIASLMAQLGDSGVGGLLAAPVSDTLKSVSGDGRIKETVSRSGLWSAMTPQMFRFGVLSKSLDLARARGVLPTDEAMAVEAAGFVPRVVRGSRDNIKITLPEDIAIAEAILVWQQSRSQPPGGDGR